MEWTKEDSNMNIVDLNCDMGEGFGNYQLGTDEDLMNYVSSINIACGFHAGDPATMRKSVTLALKKNIGIGAHPGLQDLIGFGRREMNISPQEAYDLVVYQIGALYGFVKSEGGKLQHVKPHGALYNMSATNSMLANAIAEAIYRVDSELILFGLAGSELIKAGRKIGLRTASEAFADRTYNQDGTLTPRHVNNSVIENPVQALKQVEMIVKESKIQSIEGIVVPLKSDTICIHGDGKHASLYAKKISEGLISAGIKIKKAGDFL